MKNYLLIIILSISLFGCKTTKTLVGEKTETKTNSKTIINIDSAAVTKSIEQIVKNAVDCLVFEVEIQKYSTPDSVGKQYIKEYVVYNGIKTSKANVIQKKDTDIKVEKNTQKLDTTNVVSVSNIKTEKETQLGLPKNMFFWIALVLIALALLYIIFKTS